MARVHDGGTPVAVMMPAACNMWLQEMNALSLLISELTKMLALSYDIRHPSRYLWLPLLVVHNLSLSILICLPSDISPAASLICLSHSCFFIFFWIVLFLAIIWLCSDFSLNLWDFFFYPKKSYLLLHHLPFCHSSLLLFLLLCSSPWLWVNNCSIVF